MNGFHSESVFISPICLFKFNKVPKVPNKHNWLYSTVPYKFIIFFTQITRKKKQKQKNKETSFNLTEQYLEMY